jgi:F-type H+-transporting ATPase subunit gamma
MPSTIILRRKIKSITNTRQITKAMQMVAASKMRRAQEAVMATRAYSVTGYEIINRIQRALAGAQENLSHPLLEQRPVKRVTLIVISSDRGLAGGYNGNVLKRTLQFLDENKDKQITIITIGKKIEEALHRLNVPVELSFTQFSERPVSADLSPVAKASIDKFTAKETDQVAVIYTHFYSTLKQEASLKQILPIVPVETTEDEPSAAPYKFEPTPNNVLGYILPRLVETQLLQSVLDSVASEHSSRMLAMKSATDNATELIGDLKLTYNSLRQANITQEIAEISAGANAA